MRIVIKMLTYATNLWPHSDTATKYIYIIMGAELVCCDNTHLGVELQGCDRTCSHAYINRCWVGALRAHQSSWIKKLGRMIATTHNLGLTTSYGMKHRSNCKSFVSHCGHVFVWLWIDWEWIGEINVMCSSVCRCMIVCSQFLDGGQLPIVICCRSAASGQVSEFPWINVKPNTVNLQCWNKIYFVPTL